MSLAVDSACTSASLVASWRWSTRNQCRLRTSQTLSALCCVSYGTIMSRTVRPLAWSFHRAERKYGAARTSKTSALRSALHW
jgi:hypothetical protein